VTAVGGKGGALRRPTLGPEDSSLTDVRAELIAPEEGPTRTADGRHVAAPPPPALSAGLRLA
jgi:hypothetical protein